MIGRTNTVVGGVGGITETVVELISLSHSSQAFMTSTWTHIKFNLDPLSPLSTCYISWDVLNQLSSNGGTLTIPILDGTADPIDVTITPNGTDEWIIGVSHENLGDTLGHIALVTLAGNPT